MASCCKIVKDPSNKWFLYIDWSDWISAMVDSIGGTVDITNSTWFLQAGLIEEAETPSVDDNFKCYLIGSGGVAGTKYSVMNRITYNPSALAVTDLTEDRTITVTMKEK